MGEHESWVHFLPGYRNLEHYAAHYLGRKVFFVGFERTEFSLVHVFISGFLVLLLTLIALRYDYQLRLASAAHRLVPDRKLSLRNLIELIAEGTLGAAEGVMGRDNALRFLPLIGTFVFFILVNNLIGL